MKYHILALALILIACAPTVQPTPEFERAPSLAPSATVLPIIPQENPEAFVGRSDPTAAALAAEGHPSQDPPQAAQATEQSIPITVVAEDGTVLASQYFGASAEVTVVILHDEDGDTESLMALGAALQGGGFNVMVLSMRGYSPSRGQVDWTMAASDAFSGIESVLALPNMTQVALLGTGRSASAAMRACSQHPLCAAAIVLNPAPDPASDPISEVAAGLGTRPLLILVGQDRADAGQNAQIIQSGTGGTATLQTFLDQTTVSTSILAWLSNE